jgi:hypothetical protein
VKIYPAHFFFAVMWWSLKPLLPVLAFFLFAGSALINAAPQGFLEGHLKIVSPKEVELADATPSERTAINYADYPLIILSKDREKEVRRVTPDDTGKYRVALPPGEYILDVERRRPKGHVRARPQPFTVVSDKTVQVDMAIDTGVR